MKTTLIIIGLFVSGLGLIVLLSRRAMIRRMRLRESGDKTLDDEIEKMAKRYGMPKEKLLPNRENTALTFNIGMTLLLAGAVVIYWAF